MNVQKYKEIIEDAIGKFASDYFEHPFVYVSEADIQAYLYYLIRDNLGDMFDTKKSDIPLYSFSNPPREDKLVHGRTSLLHCQSAIPGKQKAKKHYDIGFWNEDTLNDTIQHTQKDVSIAIELKRNWESSIKRKNGKRFLKILNLFYQDIAKLKNLELGYALWCLPRIAKEEIDNLKGEIKRKINGTQVIVFLITKDNCYRL